jgi:lipoprotein signal peptidase
MCVFSIILAWLGWLIVGFEGMSSQHNSFFQSTGGIVVILAIASLILGFRSWFCSKQISGLLLLILAGVGNFIALCFLHSA